MPKTVNLNVNRVKAREPKERTIVQKYVDVCPYSFACLSHRCGQYECFMLASEINGLICDSSENSV